MKRGGREGAGCEAVLCWYGLRAMAWSRFDEDTFLERMEALLVRFLGISASSSFSQSHEGQRYLPLRCTRKTNEPTICELWHGADESMFLSSIKALPLPFSLNRHFVLSASDSCYNCHLEGNLRSKNVSIKWFAHTKRKIDLRAMA